MTPIRSGVPLRLYPFKTGVQVLCAAIWRGRRVWAGSPRPARLREARTRLVADDGCVAGTSGSGRPSARLCDVAAVMTSARSLMAGADLPWRQDLRVSPAGGCCWRLGAAAGQDDKRRPQGKRPAENPLG